VGALLQGRVALVTGGTDRGIGAGLAAGLADEGAIVATTGGFASRESVEREFASAVRTNGPLDLVVHAHLDPDALTVAELSDTDEPAWERRCEMLLREALSVAQAAFGSFAGRGGHLVFVTPTVGMSGAIGLAPYASAVEAVRALAKSAARQWGELGIRVNCVAPPVEVVDPARDLSGPWLAPVALGRGPDARTDVAPAVALLSADAAHFVTGTTLVVDGGILMAP
jgi:NAD(P)-dependent dehydrogenase (short-subunit alcohol dehydrogenase family)